MAQKDVLLTFSSAAAEKSKKHENCGTLEINKTSTISS